MKHIITIIILMLSGCAMTENAEQYYNGIDSMQIGDSYQSMLDKIGDIPNDVTCYKSAGYETCAALYRITRYKSVIFRFDSNDILTSVYR